MKLIAIYSDVIISVDTAMILNTIESWSVDFDNRVNWVKKLKMSFVARFSIDNDVIIMNEVKFNDDNDAVVINKVILMFWHNKSAWFDNSAFITFMIDISALLSLTIFFDLEADWKLRCIILLLN